MTRRLTVAILAAVLLAGSAAQAELIYEGFQYGDTASALEGNGTTGGGWAGAWTEDQQQGDWSADYETTSLTFGSLVTAGGKVRITGNTSGNQRSRYDRQLDGVNWSTVYGSYLLDIATMTKSDDFFTFDTRVTDTTATNSYKGTEWQISHPGYKLAGQRAEAWMAENGQAATTGIPTGSTYLVLFEATNLGENSTGTQEITVWALTEAQFATFKTGGLTTAELNAATLGTGAGEVSVRVSSSADEASRAAFDTGKYLQLHSYGRGGLTADYAYDEFRFADTNLDDVTPIPEPATMTLLALGGLAAVRRRRR
jgi:hypothetical protein